MLTGDTSKCLSLEDLRDLKTFGFRGQILSSIAETSLLSIISRHIQSSQTYSVRIRRSHRQPVTKDQDSMPFHGTIVSITNLFGSLPVRRKYVSSLSWPAQVKAIKLALFPVALARPNISISVYDMKDSKVFAISGNKPGGPTDIMREVQVLRASCGMDIMASWDVVHARLDQFGVKGVIGLHPVSVKAAQHIRKRIHVD